MQNTIYILEHIFNTLKTTHRSIAVAVESLQVSFPLLQRECSNWDGISVHTPSLNEHATECSIVVTPHRHWKTKLSYENVPAEIASPVTRRGLNEHAQECSIIVTPHRHWNRVWKGKM